MNLPLDIHISSDCHVHTADKGFSLLLSAGSSPCRVSHSQSPLIKLQPCSLLSCWQTKVLKRTPSVIASNLRHNVVFHVNRSQRKGSCCSLPALSHFHSERSGLSAALLFCVRRLFLWHSLNISDNVKNSLDFYERILGTKWAWNGLKPRAWVVLGELLHLWPEFSPWWTSGSLQLEVFLRFGQVSLSAARDKASAGPGTGVWEQAGGAGRAGHPSAIWNVPQTHLNGGQL